MCVFTFTSFRGGHGVSLIVTPEMAASIVNSLDDSIVPVHLRDHPSSPLQDNKTGLAYEVKDMPGRDRGVMAVRKIRNWETTMVGFPSIIAR